MTLYCTAYMYVLLYFSYVFASVLHFSWHKTYLALIVEFCIISLCLLKTFFEKKSHVGLCNTRAVLITQREITPLCLVLPLQK